MRRTTMTSTRLQRCAVALFAVAIVAAVPAPALSATVERKTLAEMQKQLDASLQMIQALTERVRELEARQTTAVTTAAPVPVPAPAVAASPAAANNARLEADEQKLEQLEKENASRSADDTGLPLHGFADVGAGTHNPINPALQGFNVGNLDFYITPRLGDRTRALFEMNTEVSSEGSVGVDLERAQIGYQFNDQATVWMGRFHSPYGYVNTALHHGNWINNSLRRPKFLQFEDNGGIVPAHTVGLWVTGSSHAGTGKVLYDFYGGNSQEIIGGVLDMRNAGNAHGKLIFGGRLGYQFNEGAAEGLLLGVHAFSTHIVDDAMVPTETRVLAYGGYAVYDTDQWENIAEIYLFDNQDLSGVRGSHRSDAGFVQFGYRAPWGLPYARYERAALSQSDTYFAAQLSGASYHRVALGARFDIDLKSAIKLELANTRLTDRSRDQFGEGLVQYAIRF